MPLDLTLFPLHRINGQEGISMPGLLAALPPRKAARGREQDRLIVYLLLTGTASFTTSEYKQLAADAVDVFYQTAGSLTSALRATAEALNRSLLERNMSTSGRGQYAIGWLTLASLRETQCTLLFSGPMHVYFLGGGEARHFHEPGLSGKGLGLGQAAPIHYSQTALQAGDRLLFCGKVPSAWESALRDSSPASLEATRRRLTTLTGEDLNAVLMQATEGAGELTLLKGTAELKPESAESAPLPASTSGSPRRGSRPAQPQTDPASSPAHVVQPSAYSIPPQPVVEVPDDQTSIISIESGQRTGGDSPFGRLAPARDFPSSIPRARPGEQLPEPPAGDNLPVIREPARPEGPREPSERTRQVAKVLAGGIRAWRRASDRLGAAIQKFLPRLLPGTESSESFGSPTSMMFFIAVLVPLVVVTMASVVYLRYGRSIQYETYLQQAQELRAQAAGLTDPVEQRKSWEAVLLNVDKAEEQRKTAETGALRQEAESNLDQLLGILRLQFTPVFSSDLGIDISRMAASDTDLFMLNAANGEVWRAQLTSGRGFQLDTAFTCKPGVYGAYTVGPLVDILALPPLNSINATLLGLDASGNLLYCAPGQVAQAIPLPPPDTNWARVTAFTMDAGNLYVLDAPARAVWVYNGKDGTFLDRPYFFFGGQTPEKQDVIDLAVSGDDLYLLHADGHLSTCSYSRIETVPTRCQDPAALTNPYSAYQDTDLFGAANITQMLFTAPPDLSILLLDANSQGIFRLTPRSLELQNQLRPTTGSSNPVQSGLVGAVTVGPNHVLYLAVRGQVYFATGMP
jgi:hypothetical protein